MIPVKILRFLSQSRLLSPKFFWEMNEQEKVGKPGKEEQ